MIDDRDWYSQAVFYEVLVRSFCDSDGDGQGDLAGLASKMDYLAWLGVDCLWLPPFFPSPLRDGGYDVSDYIDVAERYGTLSDFDAVVKSAHHHGIRVIIDFVMNHTSDAHPWFQASRRNPTGPYGDYYVWRDDASEYSDARIIFLDTEESNWTYDPVRKQYYWHRFFSHQPDLNFDNPQVMEEMLQALRFWLDRGVDGFRLDAVPYLIERPGTNGENLPETHDILKRVRRLVDIEYPGRVLLCEANQWPKDVIAYFGDGDECHMAFNFPVMPRLYMGLRQENRQCISEVIAATPQVPEGCAWGTFLRNHDELTLEMVTEDERQYMWQEYAPEPRMRANLGIRRRLAPLVDNDPARIRLLHALLLALPGSPVLYYGDEIGMGDNIWLPDRDGVRTPMQWDSSAKAGFSLAEVADFGYPLITDPIYAPARVNVDDQRKDPSSLLNWVRHVLSLRQEYTVLSVGDFVDLGGTNPAVFAFLRQAGGEAMLCAFNLSNREQSSQLDVGWLAGARAYHAMTGAEVPGPARDEPYVIQLPPHGHTWISLTAFARKAKDLWWPAIQAARWFGGKGREGILTDLTPLPWLTPAKANGAPQSLPALRPELATVQYPDGSQETYQIVACYRAIEDSTAATIGITYLAGVGYVRVSELGDDPEALQLLVHACQNDDHRHIADWSIQIKSIHDLPDLAGQSGSFFTGEQSNSSAMIGQAMIKILRRVEPGEAIEISALQALQHNRAVPALWAYVEAAAEQHLYHLITIGQRIPGSESGWDLALTEASHIGATSWAREIGQKLATVHADLAEHLPTAVVPGAVVADHMDTRLSQAIQSAPMLDVIAPALHAHFDVLRDLSIDVQRIHGDFHLGQTLHSQAGWFIIDFEGEPIKDRAARLAPDSPWRDVAGMLRSFDYARANVKNAESPPVIAWAKLTKEAFLRGYADQRGRDLTTTEMSIIRAYEVDKAIYEVVYEARNRPGWVAIPLRAVSELASEQQEKH